MHRCVCADAEPLATAGAIEVDDQGSAYVDALAPGEPHKLILDRLAPKAAALANGRAKPVARRPRWITTRTSWRRLSSKSTLPQLLQWCLRGLQVWVEHKWFKRRPRAGARNDPGRRWVGKWKWTKRKDDPTEKARVIRARLTLRGCKVADAATISTGAGTSGGDA